MMGFFTGPRIAFGPGAIEQIAGLSPHRIAIVVAPAVRALDPVRRLEEWLAEFATRPTVVVGPGRTATFDEIDRLVSALGGAPDLLVAVGGGTLLDAAKALRARLTRPELPLSEWTPLVEMPAGSAPRLVAIPSTGGSGSEMTGSAHLLDGAGEPFTLTHRGLTAEWALLDPEFARSLPGPEALVTGFEAIGHALESLASEWANSFADAFSRDALATAIPALGRLAHQPRDAEARAQLFYAASRAGLAHANASLGLAHAYARAILTERPEIGYARLFAASVPTVVDYNFPSRRDVYEGILPLFPTGPDVLAESFGGRLSSIGRQWGLPVDLRALGVEAEALRPARDRIVRRVLASTATVANPRVPSAAEAGRLLDSIVNGVGRRSP